MKIFRCSSILISLWGLFLAFPVSAEKPQAQTLESWAQLLFNESVATKSSRADFELAQKNIENYNLYKTTNILVSPYLQDYSLNQAGNDFSGQSNGIKWGVEQMTPFGLSLQAELDQKSKNDLSTTYNPQNTYSFGFKINLWNNLLGSVDRNDNLSRLALAKKEQIEAELKLRNSCAELLDQLAQIWKLEQKQSFIKEIIAESNSLAKQLKANRQQGVISQLEYLGAQSELLAIENQNLQIEQQWNESVQNLFVQLNQNFNRFGISGNPHNFFKSIWDEYNRLGPGDRWPDKLAELQLQSAENKLRSEQSRNRVELDLVATASQTKGDTLATDYKEDNQKIELQLKWPLNDERRKILLNHALAEKIKSQENQIKEKRQRQIDYEKQIFDLSRQMKLIDNLDARIGLTEQIKNEYYKRFRQGRVDFQDYLRQKESWIQTKFQSLDVKTATWSQLVRQYHSLEHVRNICEKR